MEFHNILHRADLSWGDQP